MGGGSWSATDWKNFTRASTAGKSTSAIFSNTLSPDLDPRKPGFRRQPAFDGGNYWSGYHGLDEQHHRIYDSQRPEHPI